MVEPLGESKDVRTFFPELAKRIGGGMEKWYEDDVESYMKKWASTVPENPETGKSGLERLLEEGCWEDTSREPFYEPHMKTLTAKELEKSTIEPKTGIITDEKGVGIGIMVDGKPTRGFKTPSRKFEIRSAFVKKTGMNQDTSDLISKSGVLKTKVRPDKHKEHDVPISEMPIWMQPVEHTDLSSDQLIMTSFKWNVHNHGRTMNLKWLAEIVHSNPAWLNPKTAERFGVEDGDWIELTSYFSKMLEKTNAHLINDNYEKDDNGLIAGRMRVPIVTMEGIHPNAIAMSNSCGHWQYTNVAKARKKPNVESFASGSDGATYRDKDWEDNMWWEDQSAGDPSKWQKNTGNGWNQNQIMPVAPDPITGQQAFHSTVVSVRKVG